MANELPEITLEQNGSEFSFRAHSQRANEFLAAEFEWIGDYDLSEDDADLICLNAFSAGFCIQRKQVA